MNIKITKEQHERLLSAQVQEIVFGSYLFGTQDENSDIDYICIYDDEKIFGLNIQKYSMLPNIHCFQYDDVENNAQYIWCTQEQFYKILSSGDSTTFIDVMLFNNEESPQDRLDVFRNYKSIKAYLGVAKRDMKLHRNNPKKQFHAMRSNYVAECLLKRELPNIDNIKTFKDCRKYPNKIIEQTERLRIILNGLLHSGEIQMYYIPKTGDTLLDLLLQSNNIKEFKYENSSNGGL